MLREHVETKYMAVPIELAKKIEEIGNDASIIEILDEYIKKFKKDVHASLESMDEDVSIFKANMQKVKYEYRKTLDDELQKSYEVFESFDEKRSKLRVSVDTISQDVKPMVDKINEINKAIDSINDYKIKNTLEAIANISNYLNGSNGDAIRDFIKFMSKQD